MGNFEKLVVLVVLLASASVLAISLNNSETTQGSPAKQDEQPAQVPAKARAKSVVKAPKSTLPKLDSGYRAPTKQAKKSAAKPSKGGMPYILLNEAGLKPAMGIKDYMTFRPSDADTFMSLAQRFYGNRSYANAIRMANEGVARPADVDEIMVPLYDFTQELSQRKSFAPGPKMAKPSASQPREVLRLGSVQPREAAAKPSAPATNPAGGITYEVVSGDSLSVISKKVYGKASRWREIFAANRDKMKNENSLQLGMQLYIPKAGEFKPAKANDGTKVH